MVQNHLLQLVCLVAMEPPSYFNADQVRDEKLRVLRAIRPVAPADVQTGQYQEYAGELGRTSDTETYVAMRLMIDNWRWAGVPFYIRTGKKMAQRASEIVITFKQRSHDIFQRNGNGVVGGEPNRLIIRLQPSEGLRLQLISKRPGPGGMRLFPSELNLSFDDTFEERLPTHMNDCSWIRHVATRRCSCAMMKCLPPGKLLIQSLPCLRAKLRLFIGPAAWARRTTFWPQMAGNGLTLMKTDPSGI